MRNWVEDFDPTDDDVRLLASAPSQPPGLGVEETGGAYITISQHASEREHRQQQQQTNAPTTTTTSL
jgi:GTPase-activating protein SST2